MRGFTDSVRTELMHDRSNVWITMVQLPAVNTPQFNWCRTKLPDHPQPVPPIYQPEVPAEAVYWAAHHRRRELDVGFSAVKAIFGNKLAPRFADWYLARTGYESQQIHGHARGGPAGQPLRAGPGRGYDPRHVRRPSARTQLPAVGDHPPPLSPASCRTALRQQSRLVRTARLLRDAERMTSRRLRCRDVPTVARSAESASPSAAAGAG